MFDAKKTRRPQNTVIKNFKRISRITLYSNQRLKTRTLQDLLSSVSPFLPGSAKELKSGTIFSKLKKCSFIIIVVPEDEN